MPDQAANHSRLDSLLARLVEEILTPDEFAELETLLDGNPDAQRRYWRYLALHGELESFEPVLQQAGAPSNIVSRPLWQMSSLMGQLSRSGQQ